ncbi:MAG TPA: Hpt domain-containing protein [Planctomycetota bacterium]|nr:Hpt domain-containing protein [Planctomycetota bacterium]
MPDPADPVQNQLAKLKQKYAADLPLKVARVEELVAGFLAAAWTEESCFATYRQIHSLAGSAGTYGFSDLGTAARAGEQLLKRSLELRGPLGEADRKDLAAALSTMKTLAGAAAG